MTDHPPERARYLVELATPDAGWEGAELMLRRARATADGAGGGTRFIRSLFVPEDARFYLLYEADSPRQARLAAAEAQLEVTGISETLATSHGTLDDSHPERPHANSSRTPAGSSKRSGKTKEER